MQKLYQYIAIALLMISNAYSQNISRIEYFVNTDPGFGQGTAIAGFLPTTDVVNLAANIDLSAASNGLNKVYFRSKDVNGKWSTTNYVSFVKQTLLITNVVKAEYFINTDPGFGLGTDLIVNGTANVSQQAFTVNIESIPLGINTLYFRAQDNYGVWSLTNSTTFIKVESPSDIIAMEYYIDTDPGFNRATAVSVTPAINLNEITFSVDLTAVPTGNHNLFVRAKNSNGKWSLTNILAFTKSTLGVNQFSEIEKLFTAYPNPAKEQFTVQYPQEKIIKSIDLIDITGRVFSVKSHTENNQVQVETSTLASGTFFVRINTDDGVIYKKVIVNR